MTIQIPDGLVQFARKRNKLVSATFRCCYGSLEVTGYESEEDALIGLFQGMTFQPAMLGEFWAIVKKKRL